MSKVCLLFYKDNDEAEEINPSYRLNLSVDNLSRAELTNFIYDVAGDFCKITKCNAWSVVNRLDVIKEKK